MHEYVNTEAKDCRFACGVVLNVAMGLGCIASVVGSSDSAFVAKYIRLVCHVSATTRRHGVN